MRWRRIVSAMRRWSASHWQYHVRTIYADPFNVLLYPVWEIYAQSTGPLNASIVNAITGQVEQSLLAADI